MSKTQNSELKGKYMGACNRSACLMPGAKWLNKNNNNTYYCQSCAFKLNDANQNMPHWKPLTWNRFEKLTADQFIRQVELRSGSIDRAARFGRWIERQGTNWPHVLPEHPLTREEWERIYHEVIL